MQPDITTVASLIGEPARSRMMLALMSGRALTAGELGVQLMKALSARDFFSVGIDGIALDDRGRRFFRDWGVDVEGIERARRPTCKVCLDWSEREHHLAGGLGAAILSQLYARRWARRDPNTRAVHFSATGLGKFERTFGIDAPTRGARANAS